MVNSLCLNWLCWETLWTYKGKEVKKLCVPGGGSYTGAAYTGGGYGTGGGYTGGVSYGDDRKGYSGDRKYEEENNNIYNSLAFY